MSGEMYLYWHISEDNVHIACWNKSKRRCLWTGILIKKIYHKFCTGTFSKMYRVGALVHHVHDGSEGDADDDEQTGLRHSAHQEIVLIEASTPAAQLSTEQLHSCLLTLNNTTAQLPFYVYLQSNTATQLSPEPSTTALHSCHLILLHISCTAARWPYTISVYSCLHSLYVQHHLTAVSRTFYITAAKLSPDLIQHRCTSASLLYLINQHWLAACWSFDILYLSAAQLAHSCLLIHLHSSCIGQCTAASLPIIQHHSTDATFYTSGA